MINVYTDLGHIPAGLPLVSYNDTYFIFKTGTEELTKEDIGYIKEIDKADLQQNGFISTPFGNTPIQNLSTGCKTLLNVLHHPEVIFNTVECGNNVLDILFTKDNIHFYMPVSQDITTIIAKGVCFNGKDVVYTISEYDKWWTDEYKRREVNSDI